MFGNKWKSPLFRIYCYRNCKSNESYNLNKCIGTINDNTANMKKATASHILHLIIMDLLKFPTMTSFVSKVKDIIKCIKHSQVLNPIFDGIRKAKKCPKNLVLPGTTHWGSHLFCLQSMSVCKESLQTLAVYEGLVLYWVVIKNFLDDEIFWERIESTKALLEPVVNWILKLESNEDTIHLCLKAFRKA